MLDIRRFYTAISLPVIIIALAWWLQPLALELPASVQPIALALPYIFIISGMILAWIFHSSRELHILIVVSATYWVMHYTALLETEHSFSVYLLYNLLCVLVPINIAVLSIIKERGIINVHGLKRLGVILLQALLVYGLIRLDAQLLKDLFQLKFIPALLTTHTTLPHVAQLVFAISLIVLTLYIARKPSLLLASRVSILICLWFGLNIYNPTAMVWFSVIGIVFISAIVINSRQLAYLDELTNLPGRRAFNQHLPTLGKHYCIAMVDIDYFKKVNDTYGHDIGDQVLKMLATHLRNVQGGGHAFRYGGEEFIVIFAGKTIDEVAAHAENLRTAIASTVFTLRHKQRPKQKPDHPKKQKTTKELKITVSIGIAEKTDLIPTAQDVIKVADQKLYKAKKNGRNQIVT